MSFSVRINIFNSTSEIPVGRYRNGQAFNNEFQRDTALSREWIYLDTSRLTVLMPGKGAPKAQLLAGSVLPDGISSGGGTGIARRASRGASQGLVGMRVVRNTGRILDLAPIQGSATQSASAGRIPDRIDLYTLAGKRFATRSRANGMAGGVVRFEAVPPGAYMVKLRYRAVERVLRAEVH